MNEKVHRRNETNDESNIKNKAVALYPTNTPRGFHVETTWKRLFPRRFNVESTWCVCRVMR